MFVCIGKYLMLISVVICHQMSCRHYETVRSELYAIEIVLMNELLKGKQGNLFSGYVDARCE